MGSKSKIVGINRDSAEELEEAEKQAIELGDAAEIEESDEAVEMPDSEYEGDFEEEVIASSRNWRMTVIGSFLLSAAIAWTAFFVWSNLPAFQSVLSNIQIIGLVSSWVLPMILIGLLWLIAMRSSSAETSRFADAGNRLRAESEALEERMRTVNEEIALAREFLAQNAQDLESVGRQSAQKLTEAAEQLGQALADSDEKAKKLEQVSNAASENLEQLRKHLPVVTSAAKDVTNQIGSAGNGAQLQVKSLISALQTVGEAGRTAKESIDGLEQRAGEASENIVSKITSSSNEFSEILQTAHMTSGKIGAEMKALSEETVGLVTSASEKLSSDAAQRKDELGSSLTGISSAFEESTNQSQRKVADLAASLDQLLSDSGEKLAGEASLRKEELAASLSGIGQSFENSTAQSQEKVTQLASQLDQMLNETSEKLVSATAQRREELAESLAAMTLAFEESTSHSRDQVTDLADNLNQMLDDSANNLAVKMSDIASQLQANNETASSNLTASAQKLSSMLDNNDAKLREQLDDVSKRLEQVGVAIDSQDEHIDRTIARVSSMVEESKQQIESLDAGAAEKTSNLAFSIETLVHSTKELENSIQSNNNNTDILLENVMQLLKSLGEARQEIDQQMPVALSNISEQLSTSYKQMEQAQKLTSSMNVQSEKLANRMNEIDGILQTQRNALDRMMASGDEQINSYREQADTLAESLSNTRNVIEEITKDSDERLLTSLLQVRETMEEAADRSKSIIERELGDVASKLSAQNQELLDNAVNSQLGAINDRMQQAIEKQLTLSQSATAKLSAQLAQIDEMAGNLERRLEDTHDGFGGLDHEGFARRMAMLTESLNSTAIDVAKILSNDVTDTAWAAYLKGDRGVFTRRAVRLLDSGEARAIADHYENDLEFAEHVNRYIHDFEAMMRVLLSTRDGNAVGVTVLSSDVGKLYVALAQAIERLRN